MDTLSAVEQHLDAAIFIPPKASTSSFGLFMALVVEPRGDGNYTFAPLNLGITEEFLCYNDLQLKIPDLNRCLNSRQVSEPQPFITSIKHADAISGSLGSSVSNFLEATVAADSSSNHVYALAVSHQSQQLVPPRRVTRELFESCLKAFCEDCNATRTIFGRSPTRLSGNIEYLLAFVTTKIEGTMSIKEIKGTHVGPSVVAAVQDVGVGGTASMEASDSAILVGEGIVGVHVHVFHLIKTKNNPEIRVKEDFPVTSSHNKDLKGLLGSIMSKLRRRTTGHRRPESTSVLILSEGYESSHGTYEEDTNSLVAQAMQRDIEVMAAQADEQLHNMQLDDAASSVQGLFADWASLRVVEDSDKDKKNAPAGDKKVKGRFTRSDNVIYEGSRSDVESIYEGIKTSETGTVNIEGRVVDAIKPVVQGKIHDTLPIVYKPELSGIPPGAGQVPGWVLRSEREEESFFMLWGVVGGDSGIVTAYDNTDWHVRESIEYVDKRDTAFLRQLESEGFYQLHSDEADPTEIDLLEVQNGNILVMGRHVLALKSFRGKDDEDFDGVHGDPHHSVATGNLPAQSHGRNPAN